ncbi:hypothetical protein Lal_00041528 [Lupinus albus]|nr:hypothetical protein Lal_00041528 [Lupinus albus]
MVTTFIYNHIWTINVMKKYTRGREIVRPGITRFATKFLQLQMIMNQKQGLKQMFKSEEFKKSKFYKQKNGPALEARKIVLDHEFWSRATNILKMFEPIVKVLRLVGGDTKHTMDFLYEAIDRAKQSIQKHFRYHSQYNDIVDKRWKFMHSDLHSTGYFLNPQFQYGVEHGTDVYKETFDGTNNVIMKLERSIDKQIKALNQLLLFRNKLETFGTPQAQAAWSRMNPVDSDNVGSDENSGGLSPPSDVGGNDGGNVEAGGSDDEGEHMHNDPYEEMPLHRHDHNLIDVMMHSSGMVHSSDSFNGNSRTESQSRKGKRNKILQLKMLHLLVLHKVLVILALMKYPKAVKDTIQCIRHIIHMVIIHMISMQVDNFYLTSHHQQIIKNLIINNQVMYFLVMSLDKELHEMVVGMTMKIMLPHAILTCGNN